MDAIKIKNQVYWYMDGTEGGGDYNTDNKVIIIVPKNIKVEIRTK